LGGARFHVFRILGKKTLGLLKQDATLKSGVISHKERETQVIRTKEGGFGYRVGKKVTRMEFGKKDSLLAPNWVGGLEGFSPTDFTQ